MQDQVTGYLLHYGEPLARHLLSLSASREEHWDHLVVIPACGENENIQGLLQSLGRASVKSNRRTLAILVVNTRADHELSWQRKSKELLAWLKALPKTKRRIALSPALEMVTSSESVDVLFVDHTAPERAFPAKQGVGLARKLGCDIGLALRLRQEWGGDLLHTTDADCLVEEDYFEIERESGGSVALVHPYRHTEETDHDGERVSTQLYEIYLRYYELGLKMAGSPYALPTIGSTIAVRVDAYAKVRGFPKRLAGEDFYLIDKLVKLGPVRVGTRGRVFITPRFSHRVPFGTGVGTNQIFKCLERGESFTLYDPRVFCKLKIWLHLMAEYAKEGAPTLCQMQQTSFWPLLESLGIKEALQVVLRTRKTPADRLRHLHTWFDALKTLQFLHGLEKDGLASLPWEKALDQADFIPLSPSTALTSVPHWLGWMRKLTH